jgi:hypothetical protein
VVNLKIKRCHPELASAGRERDLTSARTAGVVLRIYATVCICPVLILHMPMPIRKHRRIPLPLGQRVRDNIMLNVEMKNGTRNVLPRNPHQRNRLPRQSKLQPNTPLLNPSPGGRIQKLQLSGIFQLFVLFLRRRLRRPHFLPRRECVAVTRINAEMLEQTAFGTFRQPGNC